MMIVLLSDFDAGYGVNHRATAFVVSRRCSLRAVCFRQALPKDLAGGRLDLQIINIFPTNLYELYKLCKLCKGG